MSLTILYQDEYLIIVDKPHGLLSVPGKGADKYDSVASRIQASFQQAKVVHRLDCHTSGVMLMAFGKDVQAEMSRQFHDRETEKEYVAVVQGAVENHYGCVELPLRCDINNRPKQIIDFFHGKYAITYWKRVSVAAEQTRLLLTPITGRSHQLRVHCKAMGHAIVGDALYSEEKVETLAEKSRMLLHAQSLVFTHPVSKKRLCVSANCEF